MDICDLANAYLSGKLTPIDALRDCRARIDQYNPSLNALVSLSPSAGLEAEESTQRWKLGRQLSDLDGVPIAVKDNLVVAGMPATFGSFAFGESTEIKDELPIQRLRDAGAIIIGKTNTPEFAVEGYTDNLRFGTTRNPWNPALTPGGSSGGSAAAVAAGMAAAAIGTDGGGSIRRPAAYTSLVGLKPSPGRIPRAGGLPQILLDFEVVAPLTRSVRDMHLLLSVMEGPDRRDATSRRLDTAPASLNRKMRILAVEQLGDAPCDSDIRSSFHASARQASVLRHEVTVGEMPIDLDPLTTFWPDIVAVGLALLRTTHPQVAERAAPKFLEMADRGDALSAVDFARGLQIIQTLRCAASRLFTDWDAILMPACAAQPWAANQPYPHTIAGRAVGPRGHAIYTGWVNAAGLCAMTIPGRPAKGGMPIGFQLIGDSGAENILLELAEAYETLTPWADRRPTFARI